MHAGDNASTQHERPLCTRPDLHAGHSGAHPGLTGHPEHDQLTKFHGSQSMQSRDNLNQEFPLLDRSRRLHATARATIDASNLEAVRFGKPPDKGSGAIQQTGRCRDRPGGGDDAVMMPGQMVMLDRAPGAGRA